MLVCNLLSYYHSTKKNIIFFLFNNRGEWFEREFNENSNNGINNMIY